jgi:hypothetical protein
MLFQNAWIDDPRRSLNTRSTHACRTQPAPRSTPLPAASERVSPRAVDALAVREKLNRDGARLD